MMGMGEPLYNFDNVKEALGIVADGEQQALPAPHRVLTSGVAPMIAPAADGRDARHVAAAARGELRDRLVPLNRNIPSPAARRLPRLSGLSNAPHHLPVRHAQGRQRRARRRGVVRLLGTSAKINLIPFNPGRGRAIMLGLGRHQSASPTSSTEPATPRPSAPARPRHPGRLRQLAARATPHPERMALEAMIAP
jgi:adenine C2-methylase RlmN of 23S rRNA A2503 and tRNA A37